MDAQLDIETLLEGLDAISDGIAIYGPDARPIYSNAVTVRRFAGLQKDIDAGRTLPEAMVLSVKRAMQGQPQSAIESTAARFVSYFHSGETYLSQTDDGQTVQISFRPMSKGRKAAISVDVTELRRREKELDNARKLAEKANESKSAFLANMSHEIRTPLNAVLGMAQVLEHSSLDPDQRQQVATILESGKSLMTLLNDVLDLSKIEAGKFDISAVDASLHHVLRSQIRLWKPRAEEKGLELSLAFDAELPSYARFDSVRVKQCISNLISNAIKFTSEGRVEVFASARELPDGAHLISIRVTDTGAGMDEATIERLFKPFVQADESIQRRHGGSGLGLSITRRLCELMGGEATCRSEPGRGSVFTITFRGEAARNQPESGVSARPAASDLREQLQRTPLRVLLVDDQPINRQVVRLFLRPFNFHIVEAVNGQEAIEALGSEIFDLVLLDMHMPVMDGPTCIRRIRAEGSPWAELPVIALTADAMSGDRERYLAMGMTGYLSKPLAERDLLSEINRVALRRTAAPGPPAASTANAA